jgi:DNA-binding winged helix-turn-helix (wHTH) protein
LNPPLRVRFGPFVLDSETRQLVREGVEVRLSPKAFDVLCLLLERRPKVVDKSDLHARIWPGTFVVDTNLSILVGEVRRALADTPQEGRFIRTVHKVGYAFAAEAADIDGAVAEPRGGRKGAVKCWLAWNDRTFMLGIGDNIIGRAPHCDVWLDAAGVSRQHARIRIAAGGGRASIEDSGSTNGTFVRGARLVALQDLRDGDVIQIGGASLTFRMWAADTMKKTERIRRE